MAPQAITREKRFIFPRTALRMSPPTLVPSKPQEYVISPVLRIEIDHRMEEGGG